MICHSKVLASHFLKNTLDIWSSWVSATYKAGEPAENSKWNLKISKVNTHFGRSILMHKAEILSDSLLLTSLEQPAPQFAQNQKQPTAEHRKKKDVDTNAGSGVGTTRSTRATWCCSSSPLGWAMLVREISQGKEMLIKKQIHIPKPLLAKPCISPGCARFSNPSVQSSECLWPAEGLLWRRRFPQHPFVGGIRGSHRSCSHLHGWRSPAVKAVPGAGKGGCVPGTHWNWNKAQPLESLHSPVHRLFYRCPVFGQR